MTLDNKTLEVNVSTGVVEIGVKLKINNWNPGQYLSTEVEKVSLC